MITSNLPEYKAFEEKNKEHFEVLHICIDKAIHKNLWATRIIDNSWNSTHYFMPVEGNKNTLKKFSSKKIDSFCYGGATYAFINKAGEINTKVKSPMELVSGHFEHYFR